MKKTYDILKQYFIAFKESTEEITFFFRPDENDVIIEYNSENPDIQLPEVDALIKESNAKYEGKYKIFKKHITPVLKKLQKENIFSQTPLYIYTQYVDGDKELVVKIEPKKSKSLFPEPQKFTFDLSILKKGSGKDKWWKVITPLYQNTSKVIKGKVVQSRPYQKLEVSKQFRKSNDTYTWLGISITSQVPKNIELISYSKIQKLWDFENSDLDEVFSDRFCQMLDQMGVTNIEYYPIKTICKTTKESSITYYKLANIVGLVDGIKFFDKWDFEDDGIKTYRTKDEDFGGLEDGDLEDRLEAKKSTLDKISEKIIRCKDQPQIFIVDNDIKEACEANNIKGIEFQEIEWI